MNWKGYTLVMSATALLPVSQPKTCDAFPRHVVIREWIVAGPFSGRSGGKSDSASQRSTYHHDYLASIGGETRAKLSFPQSISYTESNGSKAHVRTRKERANEIGIVNFALMFGQLKDYAAYAQAVVEVDAACTAYVFFGSDDSPKLWVNEALVHGQFGGRGLNAFQEEFEMPLVKGTNRILVKVENQVGGWSFALNLFRSRKDAEELFGATYLKPQPPRLPAIATHVKHDSPYVDTGDGDFCIYLPPDYEKTRDSFPVIYFLHGSGGDEFSDVHLCSVLDEMILQKKVPPAIMVFPSICRGNYTDRGPKKMAESFLVKDLIPFIDKTYRTRKSQGGRAISGFSMGGVGSLIYGLKHPELFSSLVAYDGVGRDAPELARANTEKIIASGIKIKVRSGDAFKFVAEGAQKLRTACSESGIFMAFEDYSGEGHMEVMGMAAGRHTGFVKDPHPLWDGFYFSFGAFRL